MRPRPFGRGNLERRVVGGKQGWPSMRPRPFGRGNFSSIDAILTISDPSMRPRPFGRGNMVNHSADSRRCIRLQCGHDLSAVETTNPYRCSYLIARLQCGHDLSAVETCAWPGRGGWPGPTFNAATTFRPWKRLLAVRGREFIAFLQCGHDLSAVETHPEGWGEDSRAVPSMRPRPFGRGNFRLGVALGYRVAPSMRPRPFGRGNFTSWGRMAECTMPFNAATTFRPWKRAHRSRRSHHGRPFNAATTFRPWKRGKIASGRVDGEQPSMRPRPFGRGNLSVEEQLEVMRTGLQCGHDLSAVETRPASLRRGEPSRPSMRPRPFGRGNWDAWFLLAQLGLPFNAATTFRPWKRAFHTVGAALRFPFNAATTFRPWKHRDGGRMAIPDRILQCGHDLSAVETRSPAIHRRTQ